MEKNGLLHDNGQSHIDHLEGKNRELSAKKQRSKEKISSLRSELQAVKKRRRWAMAWLPKFRAANLRQLLGAARKTRSQETSRKTKPPRP